MKKWIELFLLLALTQAFLGCSSSRVMKPIEQHIAGYYEYDHAWNYSIRNLGQLRCEETGWLMFNPNGTFADLAVQNHYLTLPDSSRILFVYTYVCHGHWKVQDGKFLFTEHSRNFVLDEQEVRTLTRGSFRSAQLQDWSQQIVKNATPKDRWYTFDIERLDRKWFIWSYTHPSTGEKTLWHMHRTSKEMNLK